MNEQNEQYQELYTDVASRIEEAFSAFRRTYELMNPPPTMPNEVSHDWGWKQAGMFLGLLGSVIVSASHTIPIFVGDENVTVMTIIIGVAVFVMVEMGIVVFAYSSTEQQHKTRENIRTRVKDFTRTGLYFIVAVAIAANVVYVIEHNMTIPDEPLIQSIWNTVRLFIFLAVGLSAPVIAFITGEILAVDVLEHQGRYHRAMDKYGSDLEDWQNGLNRSWASKKKQWGAGVDIDSRVKRLSGHEQNLLETVSNSSNGLDYTQTLNKKAAIQYFKDNQSEYEKLKRAVLNSNPTATKKDIAEAIAESMTGDKRGYMTVIRAAKEVGFDV